MVSVKITAAVLSVVTLLVNVSAASAQTAVVNGQGLIDDARASYYSLTRHGFNGFQAAIEPDWKVILADTATKENLKIFRSLRFSMSVDSTGGVTLNRELGNTHPAVKQIQDHLQGLLTGFFGTWAFFMISSPFPEVPIKIQSVENGYLLAYKVQATDIMLSMSPGFLIIEGQLSDSTAKRTIRPAFQKTSQGLVLLGYQTLFESAGEGKKTTLNATIDYQDVGGMKLPNRIHIKGMYGVEPVEAELRFSQYALNR